MMRCLCIAICRLDVEDFEVNCLPPILRRGSAVDRLVYKGARLAHHVLCRTTTATERTLTRAMARASVRLTLTLSVAIANSSTSSL